MYGELHWIEREIEIGDSMDVSEQQHRIAVLGIGNMGRALVERLLDRGWSVAFWNRSSRDFTELEAQGAIRLETLENLWEHADVVIAFLADDDSLADVCLGDTHVLLSGSGHRTFIDMSTVSPMISAAVAMKATEVAVDYLRSPVSGNPAVLMAGDATLYVSGPRDSFENMEQLLHSIGGVVLYVGEHEQARTLKLAINSGLGVTAQIMAELVVLGERNGIDRSILLNALGVSVVGSPFVRYKTPGLVDRDYSATFTTDHLIKDLEMAVGLAHDADVSLPVIELVKVMAELASTNGYGAADLAALLPSLQMSLGIIPDVLP